MRMCERVLWPVLAFFAVLAIWHVAVIWTHTSIFPAPAQVLFGLGEIARKGLLLRYARDSLLRVAEGYLAAAVLGVPIGLLLGWYPVAREAMNPAIQMMRPISPLAWTPVAIVWFGIGSLAPVFLIFLAAFFPIVVSA